MASERVKGPVARRALVYFGLAHEAGGRDPEPEPLWQRVALGTLFVLVAVGVAAKGWDERGPVVGIVIGLLLGTLAVDLWTPEPRRARRRRARIDFSRRHPVLDAAVGVAFVFAAALVFIPSWPVWACALLAAGLGIALVALAPNRRRAHRPTCN